jgi:hypothetical protein
VEHLRAGERLLLVEGECAEAVMSFPHINQNRSPQPWAVRTDDRISAGAAFIVITLLSLACWGLVVFAVELATRF